MTLSGLDESFGLLGDSPFGLATTVFDTLHRSFQFLPDSLYLMELYAQYSALVAPDPDREVDIQAALFEALPPERARAVLAYGNRSDLRGDLCANDAKLPTTILI